MKNWISTLIIISLFLTACLQEQRDDFNIRTFRGYVEDFTSTRTSLDEDNRVLWVKNDLISVFEDNQNPAAYKITIHSAGKPSAEFVKTANASSGSSIGSNVALYPYSETVRCTRLSTGDCRISGFEIPSVQPYSEESFSSGIFPMAAISSLDDDAFRFMNLCGVLKLQLKGNVPVRYVIVKGNAGEPLSGPVKATVYAGGQAPDITMTSDAGDEVILDCGEAGVMLDQTKATPFLIVLPPTEFSSGFTVTVVGTDGGEMKLTTSKSNPVQRSSILRMPEKTFTPSVPDISSVTSIETVSLSFDEAEIKVTVCKAVQYSGGVKLKSDFNLEQIVRDANWKIAPRITDSFVYEGPMMAFPSGTNAGVLSAGQTYVVWLAPYEEGQSRVTADQIIYKEITIPDITSGGDRNVSVSSFRAALKSVTATVSSSGARTLYAGFATSSEMASLSSDAERVKWLKNNVSPISGDTGEVTRAGLAPGTSLTLLAIAVDDAGRYGKVMRYLCSTSVPSFNEDISIALSVTYDEKTANVKVSSNGAEIVRYYYFTGEVSSSSWTRVLGGTRESAEEYMAVNSDNYLISNTDEKPLTDGCIVMDDVMMNEEHVAVVMAEDVNGRLSRAHMLKFVPELDLGDFVYRGKTKWLSTRPTVTFLSCEEEGDFYIINWKVTPAAGTTAYTICTHPNAMEDCQTPEELAVRIYNTGVEVVPGKIESTQYGDKANLVYVTWKDASGNFYEPVSFAVQ